MGTSRGLGDLQLAILRVLWQEGEASVAQVHAALLESRGLALTTIATMLSKMEKRGLVTRRTEGRQYIYLPAVAEADVQGNLVSDLTDRLFGGSITALVNHLLETQDVRPEELAELKALIDSHTHKGDDDGR